MEFEWVFVQEEIMFSLIGKIIGVGIGWILILAFFYAAIRDVWPYIKLIVLFVAPLAAIQISASKIHDFLFEFSLYRRIVGGINNLFAMEFYIGDGTRSFIPHVLFYTTYVAGYFYLIISQRII